MTKKRFSNTGYILLALAITLLIAGGVFAYNMTRQTKVADVANGTINYDPPTEEEQNSGDTRKEEIVNNDKPTTPPQPSDPAKTATVIITDAGQYDNVIEVRAFIPDHYQDGTCIITFRRGSQTVSKDTPAFRDATTTICTNPLIERSEFPSAGDWQVTVSYKSAGAAGQSETKTIKIN